MKPTNSRRAFLRDRLGGKYGDDLDQIIFRFSDLNDRETAMDLAQLAYEAGLQDGLMNKTEYSVL